MIWFLIKILFSRSKFKKILKKYNREGILEFKQKAIEEENYELAAYLEYYLNFKYNEK